MYAYTITADGRAVGTATPCSHPARDGGTCGRAASRYDAGGPRCHHHGLADDLAADRAAR